jgi:hypothetical protein
VKLPLVCLIVAGFSLSSAHALSPPFRESVNVQRLFKFSGNLTETHPGVMGGTVALHFMMYNQPYGGSAYWQETQNVHPDAEGGYTVLLGETTMGGLPADILAPGGIHWLGVQVSGQAEQPRLLLVEMPSTFKPDPMSATSSASQSAPQNRARERHMTLLLSTMFLIGTLMMCVEVVKWWKRRMEQYGPPPLANLISYIPGPERLWRATQVLWFPISDPRDMRGRSPHSVQSTDMDSIHIDEDRPKKTA